MGLGEHAASRGGYRTPTPASTRCPVRAADRYPLTTTDVAVSPRDGSPRSPRSGVLLRTRRVAAPRDQGCFFEREESPLPAIRGASSNEEKSPLPAIRGASSNEESRRSPRSGVLLRTRRVAGLRDHRCFFERKSHRSPQSSGLPLTTKSPVPAMRCASSDDKSPIHVIIMNPSAHKKARARLRRCSHRRRWPCLPLLDVPRHPAMHPLPWLRHPFLALIRLAWPTALSMVSFSVMTIVDTFLVGQLGTAELAGVGLAGTTVSCFSAFRSASFKAPRRLFRRRSGPIGGMLSSATSELRSPPVLPWDS